MTLHTILEKTRWLSVWKRFAMQYPGQTENEQYYFNVYSKLLETAPLESTTKFIIDEKVSRLNAMKWITVLGVLSNNEIDYALEFNPWAEWLGMEVESTTLVEYCESDIIAHCLFEMAYVGNGRYDSVLTKAKSLATA